MSEQRTGTVVVVGSQAGLAVGYHLGGRGLPFVVEACPGLYLMGLPFLHSISSALLGGVGRDAVYIADPIAGRRRTFRAQERHVRAMVPDRTTSTSRGTRTP